LTVGFNPFSAVHQYFPERVLLVSKFSLSPDTTVLPSLIHAIFGVGLPVASQSSVTVAPSITVLLNGLVIKFGETAKKADAVFLKTIPYLFFGLLKEINVHAIPLPPTPPSPPPKKKNK